MMMQRRLCSISVAAVLLALFLLSSTVSAQGGADEGEPAEDADDDGVIDSDDMCPDTERGPENATTEVNEHGCAPYQWDGDHDGVMSNVDNCPNTPRSEKNQVDGRGCTSFMDETLLDDFPIVGRISNGFAISAGSVSMVLGGVGWAWRASRVVGLTGGSGNRLKKKYKKRISNSKSSLTLDKIDKEIRKANDKNKLPDGAFADLVATVKHRRDDLSSITSSGSLGTGMKQNLRPSSRPPKR